MSAYWVQVRPTGSAESWRNLRSHGDEADALVDLLEMRRASQPQWEFRVCLTALALDRVEVDA